jgi:hypothetical protein
MRRGAGGADRITGKDHFEGALAADVPRQAL